MRLVYLSDREDLKIGNSEGTKRSLHDKTKKENKKYINHSKKLLNNLWVSPPDFMSLSRYLFTGMWVVKSN